MRVRDACPILISLLGCGEAPPEAREDDAGVPDASTPLDTTLSVPDVVELPFDVEIGGTAGATFECSLDGAAWSACTSPVHFDSLALGGHEIGARARLGDAVDETPAVSATTVVQLADYPNLAVIEATVGWQDVGGWPGIDRTEWGTQFQPFYDLYPDDYYSIILFTDFLDVTEDSAFAGVTQGGIDGLGFEHLIPGGRWDFTSLAGSGGTLEHVAFMHGKEYWETRWFGMDMLAVLGQEFAHRWIAYLRIPGDVPDALLDSMGLHWWYATGFDAQSVLAPYGTSLDDGDGTFTIQYDLDAFTYASIDLYGMGLLSPEEVPDFFWIEGTDVSGCGPGRACISPGTRHDVTIDDVVLANGPRVPAWSESPHEFRQAFLVVVPVGESPTVETLEFVDGARRDWEAWFSEATRGLGTIDTALFDGTRGL